MNSCCFAMGVCLPVVGAEAFIPKRTVTENMCSFSLLVRGASYLPCGNVGTHAILCCWLGGGREVVSVAVTGSIRKHIVAQLSLKWLVLLLFVVVVGCLLDGSVWER